jgi:hypothetical protein
MNRRSANDVNVIMFEERNVVVTDSLILAASSSGRGRDFVDMSTTGHNVDSIVDGGEMSLLDSEVFDSSNVEKSFKIQQIQRANSSGGTPLHFSGLAIKSTSQHNLGFNKVRLLFFAEIFVWKKKLKKESQIGQKCY